MRTEFPDPADLLNFTLTITPDEGTRACFVTQPQHNTPFLFSDKYSLFSDPVLGAITITTRRHVPRRRVHLLVQYKHQLPARAAKSQMYPQGQHRPSLPTTPTPPLRMLINPACAFLLSSSDAFFVYYTNTPDDPTQHEHNMPYTRYC